MPQVTQENRSLSVSTPLGDDVLKLVSFSGTEALSHLFTYQLEMYSEDVSIAPKDIIIMLSTDADLVIPP